LDTTFGKSKYLQLLTAQLSDTEISTPVRHYKPFHDLLFNCILFGNRYFCRKKTNSWIPACAGMTVMKWLVVKNGKAHTEHTPSLSVAAGLAPTAKNTYHIPVLQ
jgi:hypothetical protein